MLQRFLIVLIFVMLTTVVGCQNDGRGNSNAGQTIDVGILCPLTGVNASAGEDLKAGALLALDIINTRVDLPIPLASEEGLPNQGHAKLRAVFKDTRGDAGLAVQLVEELGKVDRVKAIMGEYSSTVTAAASERAEVMRIPFVNAASTSPTLTQRGLKWFFRTTPDDEIFARNFFLFLGDWAEKANVPWPKRVILVFENKLWGTSVAQAERKLAAQFGYEVVDEVTYDAAQQDFSAELERVQAAPPAVLLQASYDRDAIALVQGYRRGRIEPLAILGMNAGFVSPGFLASLGKEAENIMSREVWSLDIGEKKPLIHTINALYLKRFGRNMTGTSARSFTGMIVLADALNRARSPDGPAVREALLKTDIREDQLIMPWDGVQFDGRTGQNILGKGIIVQVQDGQYRTIWPWELATRQVIRPPGARTGH
jgi:branched-chain amino acid transport system substrate-binding protein